MGVVLLGAMLGGLTILIYVLTKTGKKDHAARIGTTLVGAGVGFALVMFGHTYLEQKEQKREMVSEIGAAYYEMECNKRAVTELLELWRYGGFYRDIELKDITFGNLRLLFEKDLTYTKITSPEFKWSVSEMYTRSKPLKAEFDGVKTRLTREQVGDLLKLKGELDSFAHSLKKEAKNIWPRQWANIEEGILLARIRPF